MSLGETAARNDYIADGSGTDFSFTFPLYDQTHLAVYQDGVLKTINTHYRVRNGLLPFNSLVSSQLPATGFIQFLDADGATVQAPPTDTAVAILRHQPLEQTSNYQANEAFPAERIERDLDKLVMQVQQLQEKLNRALLLAPQSTISGQQVDDPVVGSFARGKVGGGMDWASVISAGQITIPVPINEGGTGATTASGARSALGLHEGLSTASILDAKGDLIVATGADTPVRLGVGTDGQVLVADSSASSGLSYQSPQVSGFGTGDVKLTLKTVADSGWVLLNDTTIGDASSGATGRAQADTEALFTLLWNNTADADCAVSGGRGASAAADFAAHKTMALPKALGRALACYGSGAGLTARSLAKTLGSEDAVVVQHTHGVTDGGHSHDIRVSNSAGSNGNAINATVINAVQAAGTYNFAPGTNTKTTGISVNNAGSSGTGANMPPSVFLNVMVKL